MTIPSGWEQLGTKPKDTITVEDETNIKKLSPVAGSKIKIGPKASENNSASNFQIPRGRPPNPNKQPAVDDGSENATQRPLSRSRSVPPSRRGGKPKVAGENSNPTIANGEGTQKKKIAKVQRHHHQQHVKS